MNRISSKSLWHPLYRVYYELTGGYYSDKTRCSIQLHLCAQGGLTFHLLSIVRPKKGFAVTLIDRVFSYQSAPFQ